MLFHEETAGGRPVSFSVYLQRTEVRHVLGLPADSFGAWAWVQSGRR